MNSDEPIENCRVFGLCKAEVKRLHDALVCPRSESRETEGGCVKLANDVLTLSVDCGTLG